MYRSCFPPFIGVPGRAHNIERGSGYASASVFTRMFREEIGGPASSQKR
jgi:hypothetical protein